ncbi:MAG: PTS sugar transporter subunit IIA [Eubacteriales bacterium]|nr:PTS sugar transporter subunit IIA [Eubacteriales bacterium]
MAEEAVKLGNASTDKETAIRAAGQMLVDLGCVKPEYIDLMIEREKMVTTYMGMGVALPHGTTHDETIIQKTGVVVMQYPDGVKFDDEEANLIFGIAAKGSEHLDILANICSVLEDEELLEELKKTGDVDKVLAAFNGK